MPDLGEKIVKICRKDPEISWHRDCLYITVYWLGEAKMKKRFVFIATILSLCSSVARADGLEEAVEAYQKGNYANVLEILRPLAAQGIASAQNNLGWMYDEGKGVAQDYKEAVKWYRLAAEQGYAASQNNLGYIHHMGKGVVQDYKEAVKWYRLAAEKKIASAQNNLGWMYDKGKGITQDYKEAVKWYRLAAKQGYATAQNNLGVMYVMGKGVTQDYVRAHMWFNLAASNGDENAVESLERMAKEMKPTQITDAQMMAQDCEKKNYRSCK